MEEIKDEKQFKRGMNNGYLLAEHRPDLLDGILKANKEWDGFIEGLNQGRIEYKQNKDQELSRSKELGRIRGKDLGETLDKDR